MSTYKGKTAKAWRHPWQVVRMSQGAVIANCSHRFHPTAYLHGLALHVFRRDQQAGGYEIRRTPEVVGRLERDRAGW